MVIVMFVVAMPGYFGHAESLVEGLGAAVDGEHVKDEIVAFLPGLVDECADEAGTDAAALMIGVDSDTGEVDLPAARVEGTGTEVAPARPHPQIAVT
jgi:hypothetical protein